MTRQGPVSRVQAPEERVKSKRPRVRRRASRFQKPETNDRNRLRTDDWKLETGNRIILGVDPGSMVTGYGLIKSNEQEDVLIKCGVIRTDSKKPLPEKLKEIFEGLSQIITQNHPDELAIEETFYSKNAKSALVMGQARGVAILAGACANISVSEYSPKEVKCSIVGQGNASKHQVQFMVKNLLGLKDLPQPLDAADALAVALCHAQKIKCRSGFQP
jgi:crossover junction endodeoxyribonuclease RuvC